MKPALQFCAPEYGAPFTSTTKPGMSWLAVPRPYVAHEPRLGKPVRSEPVFIWIEADPWAALSAQTLRTTAMSSTHSPTWGNSSETSMPLLPCFVHFHGAPLISPPLFWLMAAAAFLNE